jgi:hypothetical protein
MERKGERKEGGISSVRATIPQNVYSSCALPVLIFSLAQIQKLTIPD